MYFVRSDFLAKCQAACILRAADVLYILHPLRTLAVEPLVIRAHELPEDV
jgi:hypothetical protein